ncbi:hypothetical protein LAZ67_17001223 [Cordylochernes scorpioides]|uniref:Integrase catalytic domain-containing protein n=1 Tax=Cordylochernes scorpioides TaxID=51811 RepID=A0ABY6LI17_9ARAC|nr:hypothetical protein LAZ67_17001223 [Cordylochernes scorpioides]
MSVFLFNLQKLSTSRLPTNGPNGGRDSKQYLVVSGMKKKEEADKIDLFMYLMGDHADDIFRTFKFEKEKEATKIDSVLKAFDSHFCVRKNIIYERAKFNSRIQEDQEPVDEFITSLYKLADSCEFEGLHEQLIRDQIVVGVRDKALSERMQLDSELTLEKAVKMVRQQEAVQSSKSTCSVPQQAKGQSGFTRPAVLKDKDVTYVQKLAILQIAAQISRRRLRKSKLFLNLMKKLVFLLEVSAVEDSSNLNDDEGECRRRWTEEIQVNGKQVKFKLDSQADVTCVPLCLFKKIMGQQRLVGSDINIRAVEFSELQTVGMFISTLRNGNYEIKEKIYVIRRLSEPLLSRRACELLNLARRIEVVATRINPIKEFPEVFEGLGQIGNPYEIKLKAGAKPYAVDTPRRVPIPLMEKLKTRLDIPGKELLDADALSRQPLLTTEGDTTLKAVVNYLEQGWPDKKKMSQALLSYWHVKDELGVQNGLLMCSCRLLDRLTANVVVRSCKSIFARHGMPETVVSDNGTQFGAAREFANFTRQYGFTHVTSSPRFPQSNGMAEAGVKLPKLVLKKIKTHRLDSWSIDRPLWRTVYSPAELLMGCKLRTTLPIAPENLNPRYDRRCGATDMEELSEGSIYEKEIQCNIQRPIDADLFGGEELVEMKRPQLWIIPLTTQKMAR